MPLRQIGLVGIVVMVVWGILAAISAFWPPTASEMDRAIAFACGYNAGAAMMLDRAGGRVPQDLMLEVCQPIKATAAAHGFNP